MLVFVFCEIFIELQNHKITDWFSLEKTSKIIKSDH